VTTDHFIPKSKGPAGAAYDWANYRLADSGMNRYKGAAEGILDPFTMQDDTFHINFLNGQICPNCQLTPEYKKKAEKTIEQLHLDSPENRKMRTDHYEEFKRNEIRVTYLARHSPFVYSEMVRKNLI
jgi:hypothetical protein